MSSEFLTEHLWLMIMAITPAIIAALVLGISFHPLVHRWINRWRWFLLPAAYVLTRIVLFVVIYIVISNRDIGGDIKWFQWEGLGALAGKVPYRDFQCWHSPLFPYLMAIPYGIWGHIASGVIMFIVFDLICIGLLCKLTKLLLGPERVMDIAWIWVVNPAVWVITVRYGQDESIIAALLLLAVYLYSSGPKFWNPIVLALAVLFTKFTTAIGSAIIYTYSKTKMRDALVGIGLIVIIFAPFHIAGADLLIPLREQSGSVAGLSLTAFIVNMFISESHGIIAERVGMMLTLMALAVAVYLIHHRRIPVLFGLAVGLLVFLLFAPVSYKFYRLWALGPLSIHALKTNRVGKFALYGGLLCVFDDFSFGPLDPHNTLFYIMGVIAIILIIMEAIYVYELLYSKKVERVVGT